MKEDPSSFEYQINICMVGRYACMGKRGSCKTCLENECLMKQFFFCRISFFQSPPVCPWDDKKRKHGTLRLFCKKRRNFLVEIKKEYARVCFSITGRRNLFFPSSEFLQIFESSRRLPRTAKRIFFLWLHFLFFAGAPASLGKTSKTVTPDQGPDFSEPKSCTWWWPTG